MLSDALAAAREIRRVAPRQWRDHSQPYPSAEILQPETEDAHLDIALLPEVGISAVKSREIGGAANITVGQTVREVLRCTSDGWVGSYFQSEAQLHARCASPDSDAIQAAVVRGHPGDLSVDQVSAEYDRCRRHLLGRRVSAGPLDWIVFSPLVTARIISRMSRAFLRSVHSSVPEFEDPKDFGCSALSLVDDGTCGGGPLGAPFDDEGTPRRRNILIANGRPLLLLGSLDLGPTTGNAAWAAWDHNMVVATTNCFLEPTSPDYPDDEFPPGRVFVAEDIRGFRSGLNLSLDCIEFELHGGIVDCGQLAGSGKIGVSLTPTQFFAAFHEIRGPVNFYRIQGIFGGAWCLFDGRYSFE